MLAGLRVCMLVSNNLAIDARVRKEAETLANVGADVTVIGWGTEKPQDIIDNASYQLELARPMVDGKDIAPRLGREDVWYPVRVLVNKTVTASRQRRYAQQVDESGYTPQVIRQEMIETAKRFDFDIVHAHDLDTLYAGYRIAQDQGAKLIYDSHELYLELHFLSPLLKVHYEKIEAEIFPKIDALVTVSTQIGRILCEQYNRPDLEPVVLYNGGVKVVDEIALVSSPVRLFFQGAFAPDRNLVELTAAMEHLRGKATLTLQGWGLDEEPIRDMIAERSLEGVVEIIAPCPPFEVVQSASSYDVGIINSIAEDKNFLVTLPNKLFDYMSAGLAVASTNLPPIQEILEIEGCGIVYEQKGIEHTAQVLNELVSDSGRIAVMKQASLVAAPKYAWDAQAKKLIALYQDLKNHSDLKNAIR